MEGKCLCETVTIKTIDSDEIEACHCGMCRRWGGGPSLSVNGGSDIEIIGEHSVTRFVSSKWSERAFCSKCGTHLFFYLKTKNEYFIPVGLIQSKSDFDFKYQVFIDNKPGYYGFSNETKNLTETQTIEKYTQ